MNFDTNNNYIFNTFGWILGFQKSIYGKEDLDDDNRYYAENPVNMPNTTPYYLLYINDFTNNVYDTFTEGCFPSNNTLSSLSLILFPLLSLNGLDFITAISGAATSISNVGPGLGPEIGPNGNFASLPDVSKWILSLGMILGRLELFAILVLFLPSFWRN